MENEYRKIILEHPHELEYESEKWDFLDDYNSFWVKRMDV